MVSFFIWKGKGGFDDNVMDVSRTMKGTNFMGPC